MVYRLAVAILIASVSWLPAQSTGPATEPADRKPVTTGYMRFVNESTGEEPFCAWFIIRRHEAPFYLKPGILNMDGFSHVHSVPADKSKWIAPGASSPWVEMTSLLLPDGGRNNITVHMTRKNHADGLVRDHIRGVFEFSVGEQRRIVNRIKVDQTTPRVVFALPHDFEILAREIRGPDDFIREKEKLIADLGLSEGRRARHLDLCSGFSLTHGLDAPAFVNRELAIMRALGFNNTFNSCAAPAAAVQFYSEQKLEPYFDLAATNAWHLFEADCPHQPKAEKLEVFFRELARENAPILNYVNKLRVMDEPSKISIKHVLKCETCRRVFVSGLQAKGVALKELGVETWDQVQPVAEDAMASKPALYYHTAMFRLQSLAAKTRAIVDVKRRHLPDSARSYVNLIPNYLRGLTWYAWGTDPFMLQREGGLDLGFSEDWLGDGGAAPGAHPRHSVVSQEMIRAAGGGSQPMGMYVVAELATPHLLRMKYYLAVAHGARHINVYNYGPWYNSIDSWSEKTDMYPIVAAVQREMAVIDSALHGATRRPTRIAILYNRTAAIWAIDDGACEHDASYIHWALAHAGYDAVFVSEEDIEAGALDGYAVLYMTGPQLQHKCAARIKSWVDAGGTLMGTAGAASRDEYNRPMDVLEPVFGVRSTNLERISDKTPPRFVPHPLAAVNELKTDPGSDGPAVKFKQLCYRESLSPLDGAKVVLTNQAGEPAGTLHRFGRGTALRVAALPGIAYRTAAIDAKGSAAATRPPPSYPADLREWLVHPCWLANLTPVATCDDSLLEVVRYDAPDRVVLFLIDHANRTLPQTKIRVRDAGGFNRVETATGQKVNLAAEPEDVLKLTLPLTVADVLVLRK